MDGTRDDGSPFQGYLQTPQCGCRFGKLLLKGDTAKRHRSLHVGLASLHISQRLQGAAEVDALCRRLSPRESFLPSVMFSMEETPPAPPMRLWWRGGHTRGIPPCFS
jgi:hypothetical protein